MLVLDCDIQPACRVGGLSRKIAPVDLIFHHFFPLSCLLVKT